MKFCLDLALWEIYSNFNELEEFFYTGVTGSSTVKYSSLMAAVKYHLDPFHSKWSDEETDVSPNLEDALLITRWVLTDMDQKTHVEDFSLVRALLRVICSDLENTLHELEG